MSELHWSPKKLFLNSLIVSVCLSALLGIFAILSGDFGELQVKILLTSLTISGASLCGLSCGAVYEAGRVPHFALAGVLLVSITAAMILFGLWSEIDWQEYWKTTATMTTFAIAFAHLSILQMARLTRFYQTAIWFAYLVDFTMCGILTFLLWTQLNFADDIIFRVIGVDAILIAAVSILIPILHRLSRGTIADSDGNVEATLADLDHEIATLKGRIFELEEQKFKLLEQL